MKGFTSIDPMTLDKNWFEGLHSEWALLSAGKPENFNTMVIGWGMFGPMWGIPVCEVVVRPQRYTFEFIEREETYSVAFFGNGYRKELGICGSKSGRDIDKMKETGFTPIFEDGGIGYEEANLVLVCKKLYTTKFEKEKFLSPELPAKWYPEDDFHHVYYGQIIGAYQKE